MRIRHDDALGVAKHARIPEVHERQQHRKIAIEPGFAKMCVHAGSAREQPGKSVPPAAYRDRKPHGRPKRIAAAHPIPDRQYVLPRDAEGMRCFGIGGHRHEVTGQRAAATDEAGQPIARRMRIGHGFAGGERFRGDDEKRAFRVERGKRAGELFRVDVGHEGDIDAVTAERARTGKRLADQSRTEIGTADAEIDDMTDRSPGGAESQASAQLRFERAHARLRRTDCGNDIGAVDADGRVGLLAQRRMQSGAPFRQINFLPVEESLYPTGQISILRVRDQERHRLGREPLLRPIREPVLPNERQALEALR